MKRPKSSLFIAMALAPLTCLTQTRTPGQVKPERVCVSEIVIRTPESSDPTSVSAARRTAEEVHRAIQLGGAFADLARANSQDPSAAQGGRLGCFKRGQLDQRIERRVFEAKVGETTDVIQTKVGFVVLQVTGRIDSSPVEIQNRSPSNEQPSGLRGRVIDKFERAPIHDAYVLVHSSSEPDVHVRTDGDGKYSVELAPGIYDVLISADGFSPISRKVEVISRRMVDFGAVLEFNDLGMEQERANR